ncbi:MAG: Ig-like domain-containing protein [bacterium]
MQSNMALQTTQSTVTRCPNKTGVANGYVFNSALSGKSLGDTATTDPTSIWMTADGLHTNAGTTMPNVAFALVDVDGTRHANSFISSSLDGHVEMNLGTTKTAWNDKAMGFKVGTQPLFDNAAGSFSSPYSFMSDQGGTPVVTGGTLTNDYTVTTDGLMKTITMTGPNAVRGFTYTITNGTIVKSAMYVGPPAGTSTIASDKASVTNNGIDAATITVTVKDTSSNSIQGVAVTMTGGTTSPQSGVTNASGVFTCTFVTTSTNPTILTATFGSIILTKTINATILGTLTVPVVTTIGIDNDYSVAVIKAPTTNIDWIGGTNSTIYNGAGNPSVSTGGLITVQAPLIGGYGMNADIDRQLQKPDGTNLGGTDIPRTNSTAADITVKGLLTKRRCTIVVSQAQAYDFTITFSVFGATNQAYTVPRPATVAPLGVTRQVSVEYTVSDPQVDRLTISTNNKNGSIHAIWVENIP